MTIYSDVKTMKKNLKAKAYRQGIYENFGQKEVYKLSEKYNYSKLCYGSADERNQAMLIDAFDHWCQVYTGRED